MKKWKVIARDYFSPFVHASAYFFAASNLPASIVDAPEDWVVEYTSGEVKLCVEPELMSAKGKLTLEKLENEEFFKQVVEKSLKTIEELEKYALELNELELKSKNPKELFQLYKKLFDLWLEMNSWGHVVNLADFEHFLLTNRIIKFLGEKIKENKVEVTSAEAFSLLTTAKRSKLQQQDLDFYAILEKMQKRKDISSDLKKHVEKYKWMQFHYDGPTILDEVYFLESLKSAGKQEDGAEKLSALIKNEEEIVKKQAQLTEELKLSEKERYWIEIAREFAFLKGLRKDVVFEASCNSFPLTKEIARRLELTTRQVRFMTLEEVENALTTGKIDLETVNQRSKYCVQLNKGKIVFYVGEKARQLAAMIYEDEAPASKEIKGTPAFPGSATGIVKIINNASDMKKFEKGNILVSPATNPNLVSIMKIAGAIVTNEGGITCHAAIVSRELKVPCVIGTKIATKWLKDGDVVEVDATTGIVKKL